MGSVEYDREAAHYQRARGMSLDAIAAWRAAIAPYLAGDDARPVLDVGAGAGQFARAFATWFERSVVALEPSPGMRHEAQRANAHPHVRWVGGRADELPLARQSCAAGWLSTVVHHVADLAACARDLRRVLADGAPVLVRSAFPGRDHGITLLRYFPAARRRLAQFPSLEQVIAAFAGAGFRPCELREVEQVSAASLRDFRDRVAGARHADSLLASLDDATFAHGMTVLDDAVRGADPAAPVRDSLTLLVLR